MINLIVTNIFITTHLVLVPFCISRHLGYLQQRRIESSITSSFIFTQNTEPKKQIFMPLVASAEVARRQYVSVCDGRQSTNPLIGRDGE